MPDEDIRDGSITAAIAAILHLLEVDKHLPASRNVSIPLDREGRIFLLALEALRLVVNEYTKNVRPGYLARLHDPADGDLLIHWMDPIDDGFSLLSEAVKRVDKRMDEARARHADELRQWSEDAYKIGMYEDENGLTVFPPGVEDPEMPERPQAGLTEAEAIAIRSAATALGAEPVKLPRRESTPEASLIRGTKRDLTEAFGREPTYAGYLKGLVKIGFIEMGGNRAKGYWIRFLEAGKHLEKDFRSKLKGIEQAKRRKKAESHRSPGIAPSRRRSPNHEK
jgi:hypothetical protein